MPIDNSQSREGEGSSLPVVYLMYHELEVPGRPLADSSPGYVRYAVSQASFAEQMRWLEMLAWRGMSVSEGLQFPHPSGVVITFDDGCETDLEIAAALIQRFNFTATFYLTVGYLGTPGHLSRAQARQLGDLGFEIGCHSMTHPYLTELSELQLNHEIVEAKAELEQIVGRSVIHFSCPGGRWSPAVARIAQNAGYCSVATSRPRPNRQNTDHFSVGRVAIMRTTALSDFEEIVHARGLWKLQLRNAARSSATRLLGNTAYDRVRNLLLGH